MARPIVLISHLFRLADVISFRKDYSLPSSPPSRPYTVGYVEWLTYLLKWLKSGTALKQSHLFLFSYLSNLEVFVNFSK